MTQQHPHRSFRDSFWLLRNEFCVKFRMNLFFSSVTHRQKEPLQLMLNQVPVCHCCMSIDAKKRRWTTKLNAKNSRNSPLTTPYAKMFPMRVFLLHRISWFASRLPYSHPSHRRQTKQHFSLDAYSLWHSVPLSTHPLRHRTTPISPTTTLHAIRSLYYSSRLFLSRRAMSNRNKWPWSTAEWQRSKCRIISNEMHCKLVCLVLCVCCQWECSPMRIEVRLHAIHLRSWCDFADVRRYSEVETPKFKTESTDVQIMRSKLDFLFVFEVISISDTCRNSKQ